MSLIFTEFIHFHLHRLMTRSSLVLSHFLIFCSEVVKPSPWRRDILRKPGTRAPRQTRQKNEWKRFVKTILTVKIVEKSRHQRIGIEVA